MGHAKRGGERVLESRHLIALFLGVVLLCCVFFTLGYVMGRTQYGNTPVEAAGAPKALHPDARNARATQPSPTSTEWDFYTEKKTTDVPLKPAGKSSLASSSNSAGANNGWEEQPLNAAAKPSARMTETSKRVLSPSSNSSSNSIRTIRPVVPPSVPKREPSAFSGSASSARPQSVPARFRAPQISRRSIVLQITAVRRQSDALRLADKLQRRGFPAFVATSAKGGLYRVEVGPFETKSIGEQAKKSLQREGFKPIYRR